MRQALRTTGEGSEALLIRYQLIRATGPSAARAPGPHAPRASTPAGCAVSARNILSQYKCATIEVETAIVLARTCASERGPCTDVIAGRGGCSSTLWAASCFAGSAGPHSRPEMRSHLLSAELEGSPP
ncbi:hypothetical protein EVAR_65264_1 [Eumeta japonica]|uniref:Uncharacterized protein n=1 Tax=Eumeta variegata TaxID=151549 RepID=A0A4C1ZE48_EUMVA|nr:hypothetical protein EVAR_65264_1 [Eumeta japonica]